MALRKPVILKSGLAADLVISDLQKSCRRSLVYQAVARVRDLSRSGFAHWAWKRIFTIVSEDVGLAEPHMAATIHALHSAAILATGKRNPTGIEMQASELQLVHAVFLLATAKKSRAIPEISFVEGANYDAGERLAIPDYAIDMHTAEGRSKGRRRDTAAGVRHWRDHAKVLINEVEISGGEWRAAAAAQWDAKLAAMEASPDNVEAAQTPKPR